MFDNKILLIFFIVILVVLGGYYASTLNFDRESISDEDAISDEDLVNSETKTTQIPANMIYQEFETKVVYSVGEEITEADVVDDCTTRGGIFDSCGNICDVGVEACPDVCVFTCEF